MIVSADESWYTDQDRRKKLSRHCPIAANDKCPRYYQSQYAAAIEGAHTIDLPIDVRTRIEEMWASSDAFASMEQSVGTWTKADGTLRGVAGFCPEVTARLFGLYCSDLRTYPDEEARRANHDILAAEGTPHDDLRWNWMVAEPRHYTECHEFSVHGATQLRESGKATKKRRALSPKLRFTVFARDGWRCVYCGNAAADSTLHVDHRIAVANGGTDALDNLATACEECNLGKGASDAGNT